MNYVFVLLLLVSPAMGHDVNELTKQLEVDCPKYLTQFRVPGMGVALIRNGQVVYQTGFGVSDCSQ